MKRRWKQTGGMTLVEVIVVLIVVAILAAILIPAMTGWIGHSRQRACLAARKAAEKEYNTFDLVNTGYGAAGQDFAAFLKANGESLENMCPGGGTCSVEEFKKGTEDAYCKITCSIHGND